MANRFLLLLSVDKAAYVLSHPLAIWPEDAKWPRYFIDLFNMLIYRTVNGGPEAVYRLKTEDRR